MNRRRVPRRIRKVEMPGQQFVRDPGKVPDHIFEIRFLDPGVQAYFFKFV
jgi:hypothetical protein